MLLIFIVFFFILDRVIVDNDTTVRDKLWIPVMIIEAAIFVFLILFLKIFFTPRETIKLNQESLKFIFDKIQEEKPFYNS